MPSMSEQFGSVFMEKKTAKMDAEEKAASVSTTVEAENATETHIKKAILESLGNSITDPVADNGLSINAEDKGNSLENGPSIDDGVSKQVREGNGSTTIVADDSLPTKTGEKRESTEKEPSNDDGISKRVREGRKWNERSRNHFIKKPHGPDYRKNVKSDFTSQEESSDPFAIRKQVEFYFSDSNLLQDKFLFTKVEGHQNLPVPISLICSFRRMRHFQPLSAIVDALKESTTLNVTDNDACVQRKEPLPEGLVGKPMLEISKVHEDISMARSIYAKGFGEEGPTSQFDIEAFFANYGTTNSVRLRRSLDQYFKGSVFVEFDSEATQKSFLTLDPKPQWQGKELKIMSKKQYCDQKVDDIHAGKVRPNEHDGRRDNYFRNNYKRNRGSPDYGEERKDSRKDDRDWRVRREEDGKSGFRDRNGGRHRGFGSSGRGRGGRSDRGGRDRDGNRNSRDERGVPNVRNAPVIKDEMQGSNKISSPKDTPLKDIPPAGGNESSPIAKDNGDKISSVKTEAHSPLPAELSSNEPSSKKHALEEDTVPDDDDHAIKKSKTPLV